MPEEKLELVDNPELEKRMQQVDDDCKFLQQQPKDEIGPLVTSLQLNNFDNGRLLHIGYYKDGTGRVNNGLQLAYLEGLYYFDPTTTLEKSRIMLPQYLKSRERPNL